MRKWRSPEVPADDEWAVNHQIVVSKFYRSEILSLAHENHMSGHLGIKNTYYRILNHFYWPGLKTDVSNYCRSCHTCQVVGKPNQVIPKAGLQPIPAFDEPFSRIILSVILSGSVILKDLDQKLSDLDQTQRDELKKVDS